MIARCPHERTYAFMSELIENHAISKWMLISITINGSLVFDLVSKYNSDTKFETPEEQKQKG